MAGCVVPRAGLDAVSKWPKLNYAEPQVPADDSCTSGLLCMYAARDGSAHVCCPNIHFRLGHDQRKRRVQGLLRWVTLVNYLCALSNDNSAAALVYPSHNPIRNPVLKTRSS
jgi:hypothetical protein